MRRSILIAALLAACGGGGAYSPTETEPPGTPTEPVTPPEAPGTPPGQPAPPAPPAVNAPMTAVIQTSDRFFVQTEVTIAVGGTVTFVIDDNWHDIAFDPVPPGGDILDIEEGESVSRTFTTAGTYRFRCNRHEDGGTIHVVAADTSTAPPATPPPSAPAATITTPGVSFAPATVTIQAGQSVLWQISGARHNVTFRGAQPSGGNIPDTEPGQSVTRTFTTAGTYAYDCTRHNGMSGTINVQ
jgi:plastocyanin